MTASLPSALSAPPSLETIWHIVRRRWLLLLCLGTLTAGLGFAAVWLLVPSKYTATRSVRVLKPNRNGYESEEAFQSFVRAQSAMIKGQDVLAEVVKTPAIQQLNEIQAKADPKQWLQEKLLTDTLQSPEILRISLSGDNPEELATILDVVIDKYIEESKKRDGVRLLERRKALLAKYEETAELLREKRFKLSNQLREDGVEDPTSTALRQGDSSTANLRPRK